MAEEQRSSTPKRSRAPVSTPFAVHWREFRISVVPMVTFGIAAFATFWLWKNTGTSTGVAGISEGTRSVVSSPIVASVQRVLVRPYQMVQAGDPIAVIVPLDPGAELDMLRTELDIARLQLQPSIAEENAMNFEQIRVDLLRTKSELAVAKVNLARAENQVKRNAPLFAEKLVSEDIYDLSVKTREMFEVEVFEKSNAIAQIEKRLGELNVLGVPQIITNSAALTTISRLQTLRATIATNWGPMTLLAPISGMVSMVSRHEGEHVVEGEPLIGINSPFSERVVGYLRQPYPIEPEVGMSVVMTTRERTPRKIIGAVEQIGAQVEMITNALAFIRTGALVDSGLPVVIALPDGVNVRPGEILDLSFRRTTGGTAAAQSGFAQHRAAMSRKEGMEVE